MTGAINGRDYVGSDREEYPPAHYEITGFQIGTIRFVFREEEEEETEEEGRSRRGGTQAEAPTLLRQAQLGIAL